MQITTTDREGLMIKINKDKFGFTFFDKKNNCEIILEEEILAGLQNQSLQVCFIVDNREELNLVAQGNL